MLPSFLFAVATFIGYMLATNVLLRTLRTSPVVVVVAAALVLYPIGLLCPLLLDKTVLFWAYSSSYWCLVSVFLMAFGAILKSISLRILLDLLERPDHSEDYKALLQRYLIEVSLQDRLVVMQELGLAYRNNATYELSEKGRTLARRVRFLQSLFAIEKSG